MGLLIRRENQSLKRLATELSEVKEEAFNKKTNDFTEEFATVAAATELLQLFVVIAKQPHDQAELIAGFKGKQIVAEVVLDCTHVGHDSHQRVNKKADR